MCSVQLVTVSSGWFYILLRCWSIYGPVVSTSNRLFFFYGAINTSKSKVLHIRCLGIALARSERCCGFWFCGFILSYRIVNKLISLSAHGKVNFSMASVFQKKNPPRHRLQLSMVLFALLSLRSHMQLRNILVRSATFFCFLLVTF